MGNGRIGASPLAREYQADGRARAPDFLTALLPRSLAGTPLGSFASRRLFYVLRIIPSRRITSGLRSIDDLIRCEPAFIFVQVRSMQLGREYADLSVAMLTLRRSQYLQSKSESVTLAFNPETMPALLKGQLSLDET